MTELKPCPFCGEPEEHKSNCYIVMIARVIEDDWREIPLYTDEELEEAWNTRATDNATQHTHCCPCGAQRTCKIERVEHDEYGEYYYTSCGHCTVSHSHVPGFCSECGAKVVEQ